MKKIISPPSIASGVFWQIHVAEAIKLRLRLFTSILLIVVGLGFLAYPTLTDLGYAFSQNKLKASAKEAPASNDKSNGGISLPDGVVCKISISKIGLDAYVVEGTSPQALRQCPGHYSKTPLPGQGGNCGIAAHRTMYGHAFRRLDELEQGDKIRIYTRDGKYTHRVIEKKTVKPTELNVIAPTEDARLTLTTCHPVGTARQRLVVVSQLEG